MNCKIPFTKDILFEKKLYEITSISLEHEIKVEDSALTGNFIVTGDFKSHEVSVNKEAFSYVLPFVIDLTPDVDPETIEFMIEDFTYQVVENNTLRVNIDFNVIASKKEIEEEPTEEIFQDASELLEVREDKEENIEEKAEAEEAELVREEELEDVREQIAVSVGDVVEEKKEEIVSEETIINNISGDGEEYATYHIHLVSDGESVETICTMYNSNLNILADYNDLNNLASGDKLIIPDKNE